MPGAQVMADMKGGESEPWDYRVASREKLKDHRYEVVGEEEIAKVLGRLRILIPVRHKEGKTDYRFWTSPKHNYKYEMYLEKLSGSLADR